MKIRRALLSVSDKAHLVELGQALSRAGAELIATGKTRETLEKAGLACTPIEQVTGCPEAFHGRMKTLSFQVFSGILFRRGHDQDEKDLHQLGIRPIDCVVVNFYPFEKAVASGAKGQELIEQIDIGGPALVRAAAKNSPDVLVLTDPAQYGAVISELSARGDVSPSVAEACAARAWARVLEYDHAIASQFNGSAGQSQKVLELRYGENPHQKATLRMADSSPVEWMGELTAGSLSYNNIQDVTAAYDLMSQLMRSFPGAAATVIVKHGNPCGVSVIQPRAEGASESDQREAVVRAWQGDPVSAFGGVMVLSHPLTESAAEWLEGKFVEVLAAPGLRAEDPTFLHFAKKRKNLKAVAIQNWGGSAQEMRVQVPGGELVQTADLNPVEEEELRSVTRTAFPSESFPLVRFGIQVCRSLKSNAVCLVRELPEHPKSFQLVGAGQGQPNRVEALKALAIPRAQSVLREEGHDLRGCILVSDAFFPFRDTVDVAHAANIRAIVQPGGSIRDADSIHACDEHGIRMAFTGRRHFRH